MPASKSVKRRSASAAKRPASRSASPRKATRAAAKPVRSAPIPADVRAYHSALSPSDRKICDALAKLINAGLPGAECKVWHRHPVWFLDGNPIVGYSKLKDCIRLLFWSGQSFDEPGLAPEGSFKAAEARFTNAAEIPVNELKRWLKKSSLIQWDYKNIVKRKGRLERLDSAAKPSAD